MKKKVIASILSLVLAFTTFGCGNGNGDTSTTTDATTTSTDTADATEDEVKEESKGEPTVIRYGTHWVNGLDPNFVDEVTGEYAMNEIERQAALAALEAIKTELNVEFEFIQFSGDTRNDLMTSVLAGNPICDLATIWGGAEGTILAQNILQQLDGYESMFTDEESSWMWYDKLYGHNYLLTNVMRYKQRWPLVFNISMIEKVDALKDENGKTIYPMDLFLDGEWTFSTFTDYLSKIQAYYANVAAPDGCVFDTVQAYETDHRFAGMSAMYASGGAIYGEEGLAVESEASVKGVQYIEELMSKKLLTDPGVYDDGYTPQWTTASTDFSAGGTVFTDSPDWYIGGNASAAAERGESIGIVPWPRADELSLDSPEYGQVITLGDSVGVLKGVDEEKTELALEAYKLYWQTYYKVLGGVDKVSEFKEQNAISEMATLGFDVYNEEYGDQLVECFNYIAANLKPDYADLLDLRVKWDDIMGKSLYGIDGMSSYDVAIKANISDFTNIISNMESILASNEVKDNRAPEFTNETAILEVGSSTDGVDWSQYMKVKDAVDGEMALTNATVTVNENLDMKTPGKYENAVTAVIKDSAGNEAKGNLTVVVYNKDNKEAPVITLVDELPTIKVDTDTAGIKWSGDFIKSAVDVDGLDISANIVADLSELDTTTPGTYKVLITVTDYAGNISEVTLDVTVAAE